MTMIVCLNSSVNVMEILIPVLIFAGLGLFFGIVLAIASKVFAVKVDERIPKIVDALPGANCGGCGFSGCSALAEKIVDGEAKCTACAAGGDEVAAKIAEIMGVPAEKTERRRAQVLCSGGQGIAKLRYHYEGAGDCLSASKLGGGDKLCPFGCIGLGSCVAACKFGAISVENGVAVVNPDRCTACGACVAACPKKIIRLIPSESAYYVGCSSRERGADARLHCDAGCIGCKLCEKNCPTGAITVTDSVATIDPAKCIGCGVCAEKCPRKIIRKV